MVAYPDPIKYWTFGRIWKKLKNHKVRICNPAFNQCCGSGIRCLFWPPRSGIRDGQKSGSAINIPDPPHCFIINPQTDHFETVCAGMQKRLRSRYLYEVRAWKIRKVRICIFSFDPNPAVSPPFTTVYSTSTLLCFRFFFVRTWYLW